MTCYDQTYPFFFFFKIKLLNTAASLNVQYPTVNHNGIDA